MSENPLRFFWADRRRRLPYRRYLDLEDRSRRLAAQDFSLLTLACGALYLAWLSQLVLRTRGWQETGNIPSPGCKQVAAPLKLA